MNTKQYAIRLLVATTVFSVFLLLTSPEALPVYVFFIPYVILGFMAYFLWMAVGLLFAGKPQEDRRAKLQAAAGIFAAFVIICGGLSSLGEFTFRDFIVTLLLAIGTYFYIAYTILRK